MRLERHIRPYLDKKLTQILKNWYLRSPIDMGYKEQINHLTLLSLKYFILQ